MNSSIFIVKIISTPKQHKVSDDISVVKTQVRFGNLRKKKSFDQLEIALWGKLGKDFLENYRIGDYMIVKGVLSFKQNNLGTHYQKETKMTVTKFYPFLLPD